MTDELCARPGCGAPKAWHTRTSTVAETDVWPVDSAHTFVNPRRGEGGCLGYKCYCPAYVAPEPERKPYVVELTDEASDFYRTYPGDYEDTSATQICHDALPLDEYLAAHPQPEPKRCICGGREDEHHDGMACLHVVKFMNGGGTIVRMGCECERFREATS